MDAPALLEDLHAAGLSVQATDGRLLVTPASRLTDAQRTAIRETRDALLQLLARPPGLVPHLLPGLQPEDAAPATLADPDTLRLLLVVLDRLGVTDRQERATVLHHAATCPGDLAWWMAQVTDTDRQWAARGARPVGHLLAWLEREQARPAAAPRLDADGRCPRWLLHYADRDPEAVTFAPAVAYDEAAACPGVIAAEPLACTLARRA